MRRARPWLIGLILLVLVFVAADRITLVVAEHRAAQQIRTAQKLSSTPSVEVVGFPFLTQLANGTLGTVHVTATDVIVGAAGRDVRIASLRATLHHVKLHSLSSATAQTATAAVLLDYRELSTVLGVPVTYGGNDRVVAHPTVAVLGQQVSGTVSAAVAVSSDAIHFVDLKAAVDNTSVPDAVTSALSNVLTEPLSLARLPFHFTVQSVRASSSGVTVVLTARDVTYG